MQEEFKELGQLMSMYGDDGVMRDVAMVKCKAALEFFVWEKANSLLPGIADELAETLEYLRVQMREQVYSLERLVHRERMEKAEILDAEKDRIIANLRKDLGVKR